MRIHPVPVELFHVDLTTDEQTDIKKLTAAFRNFANASKNDRDDSCTEYLVLSFRTTDTEDEMARSFRKVKRLTTNRHPEDFELQQHRCENLQSYNHR